MEILISQHLIQINNGWDITVGEFNYAYAGSGVRYMDVTSGNTFEGSNYTGRLLMIRWDGSGSTTLNSVYSLPVNLEANKRYQFSFIYEWWKNASSPVLTFRISTNKDSSNPIASKELAYSTRNALQNGEITFYNDNCSNILFNSQSK